MIDHIDIGGWQRSSREEGDASRPPNGDGVLHQTSLNYKEVEKVKDGGHQRLAA